MYVRRIGKSFSLHFDLSNLCKTWTLYLKIEAYMRQMASNLTANDDDGVSKGLTLTFLLIAIGIILPIYQVLQAQKKMSYACFKQIHLYIRKVLVLLTQRIM